MITLEEFKKLKIGDKVRLTNLKEATKLKIYISDKMEPYLEKVVTIKNTYIGSGENNKYFKIEEDDGFWDWNYLLIIKSEKYAVKVDYQPINRVINQKEKEQLFSFGKLPSLLGVSETSYDSFIPSSSGNITLDLPSDFYNEMIKAFYKEFNNPIKNVIFSNPATIVIWKDGTKTIVKAQEGETYSAELGLAMCISKKFLGNNGNYYDIFKKWLPKEDIVEITDLVGKKKIVKTFTKKEKK